MKDIKMNLFPGGARKALIMSYDDGQIFDLRLADIFNKNGIKGTFHLNSGTLDTDGFLTREQAKTALNGHEISVHCVFHPFLTDIPRERVIHEIMQDRSELEEIAGYPVRGMSYPFGAFNQSVVDILRACGMEYGRIVGRTDSYAPPDDFLTWCPNCHHDDDLMNRFDRFMTGNRYETQRMSLLYVWGHSYEFDRNNNWQLMEEFCAKAGESIKNGDLCPLTNIGAVDYYSAVKNLKFSVDLALVQNPSATDVWFSANGEPIYVKGGTTSSMH